MNVKLLTSTEALHDMENFAALAYLTCHANTDKEYVPHEKLERAIKDRHESILEHINLTFSIHVLSRACLQELARHRHISLSVESTRHTLKKQLKDIRFFDELPKEYLNLAQSFAIFAATTPDMPNDELKYYLPEFWPTNLIITLNIREFRHILKLRTAPAALKEFRILARSMFNEVPEQFKYLLQDCVHEEVKHE
ncbi:MAG: FAD-dependent thymidylate synthase [Synergistaceae bacterium]|nr:FAD-dependent thymidylate synthase [Synergistaceae bacterium]